MGIGKSFIESKHEGNIGIINSCCILGGPYYPTLPYMLLQRYLCQEPWVTGSDNGKVGEDNHYGII